MERIGLHFAGRFLGHLVVLGVVASIAGAAFVPAGASVAPSPWVAVAPLSVLAAAWTARRLRQRGELFAAVQGGTSLRRAALPAAFLAAVLQLAVAVPGTRTDRPFRFAGPFGAAAAVGGSLLVVAVSAEAHGDGGPLAFHWDADRAEPDRWVVPDADAVPYPPGFVPQPTDRGRLRRQLFAVGTPLRPTGHPLDPSAWRWAWLAAGSLGVLLAMGSESVRWGRLAPVPLVVVAFAL